MQNEEIGEIAVNIRIITPWTTRHHSTLSLNNHRQLTTPK